MITADNAQEIYNDLRDISRKVNRHHYNLPNKPKRPTEAKFRSNHASSEIIADVIGDSPIAVHALLNLLTNGTREDFEKLVEPLTSLMFLARLSVPSICEHINQQEVSLVKTNRALEEQYTQSLEKYAKDNEDYKNLLLFAETYYEPYRKTILEIHKKLVASNNELTALTEFERYMVYALIKATNGAVGQRDATRVNNFNPDLILKEKYVTYEFIITVLRMTGVVTNEP